MAKRGGREDGAGCSLQKVAVYLTFDVAIEVVVESIRPIADLRRQIVDQVDRVASIDAEAFCSVVHLLLHCGHTYMEETARVFGTLAVCHSLSLLVLAHCLLCSFPSSAAAACLCPSNFKLT